MNKNKELDEHDRRIIKALKYPPRLLGFDNYVEFISVRKKGKGVSLFISAIPEGLKLTDLGYIDEWSKQKEHNKVIEQFRIRLDKEQLKILVMELQKRIKK